MLFASSLGQIVHPLFIAFATVLAWFYSLVPNYEIAIALLTITVMIVAFPITRKGTRSMMKMQLLAPELKKIQAKYKVQPSMTVAEKQAARARLNEEMMALYKENNVSPTGGCLPMFMQFPIFIILYDTIRALTHKTKSGALDPLYINKASKLYHAIKSAKPAGDLRSFGINLTDSVRTHGLSWGAKTPYIALILVAIALQYIQMKQLSGRNPAAAAANPQMQQMQKVMPIIFAVIYIAIPAGVNVYFIVSSLFRIGQQEFMYRHDPHIRESMTKLKERTKVDPKVLEAKLAIQRDANAGRRGILSRLAPPAALQEGSKATGNGAAPEKPGPSSRPPARAPAGTNRRPSAQKRGNASPRAGGGRSRQQARAQGKRPRRPR
jgi:YidC/Oxa1 family membrane protein insertase